jgi:hypothetical protein
VGSSIDFCWYSGCLVRLNMGLRMSVYVSFICKLSLLRLYMRNRSNMFIN